MIRELDFELHRFFSSPQLKWQLAPRCLPKTAAATLSHLPVPLGNSTPFCPGRAQPHSCLRIRNAHAVASQPPPCTGTRLYRENLPAPARASRSVLRHPHTVFSDIVRASLPSSSFVKTDRPSRGAPANHCCRGAGTPRVMVCACGIHYFTLHPSFPAVFPYRLAARTFRGMHDPSPSHPRFEAHCEGARIGMGSGTTDALGVGAAWCVGWWVWTPRGGLLGV